MPTRRHVAVVASEPVTVEKLLQGANPEQAEVVLHEEGPLKVEAGAGAGKTLALVRRVACLVVKRKVEPGRILAVTFSKKAADEMLERLQKLLPDCGARFSTSHSLGFSFIREEQPEKQLGSRDGWQVDQKDHYRTMVKDVLGWDGGKGMQWQDADLTVVLQYISLCKARCAPAGSEAAQNIAQVLYEKRNKGTQYDPNKLMEAYFRAEDKRMQKRLITFDDMLLEMWRMLSENEHLRAKWASRWDFVLQDEAQDENHVQRGIVEMLARDHRNYMVVGDIAQAIYGFRGSDPTGMRNFEERWKLPEGVQGLAPKVVRLHRNYRCGTRIIDAANSVLKAMDATMRMGSLITAERGTVGDVKVTIFEDADAEAEGVVKVMNELHEDGVPWKHMVVLYRTNAQSRALEEACLSARVPYVVVGGTNFYDRREIKDLLCYLRIAAGRGTVEDVRRCINTPFRFLGAGFLDKIKALAGARRNHARSRDVEVRGGSKDGGVDWTELVKQALTAANVQYRQKESALQWCGLIDQMAQAIARGREAERVDPSAGFQHHPKPAGLIKLVLDTTDYLRWLARDEGSESPENNRVSNVRELERASERFSSVDGLLDYVDNTLAKASAAKQMTDEEAPDRVTMMSIHRSKGLEWPAVFVIGVNEKVLPHAKAEDVEEERRLAYVAITRARDRLSLSCMSKAAVGARVIELEASRFVEEAGLVEVLEWAGELGSASKASKVEG